MSIWVTGDTHGDFRRFSTGNFPVQQEMTKEDIVIICGDFGGVWNYKDENKNEKYWLDWLDSKPFTVAFVCGNHENFDRIYSYPVKEWNGGKVHEIRPSILHLMRGEVFTIEGKKFFTFGGASSHDIKDGILDPVFDAQLIAKWSRDYYKMFRVNKISWWEQELPTDEEMEYGIKNLEQHENKVDYILTHCAAASTVALMGQGLYEQDKLTKYLEKIRVGTDFKRWYFGHYHDERQINDKEILLYEKIVRIC